MAMGLGADVLPLDVTHHREGGDLAGERRYIGATVEPPRLVLSRVLIRREQTLEGDGPASFMIKQVAIGPNEDGTELEGERAEWYTESPQHILAAFNAIPNSIEGLPEGGYPIDDPNLVQFEAALIGNAVAAAFRQNTQQRA